jgi:ketosteroid isomerase-like protein
MKSSQVFRCAFAILIVCLFNPALALADDRKTVADLDTAYQAAVKINDAATMDRILAGDFILVDGDGTTSTKADLLKESKSRRITYEHQDEIDNSQNVRLWSDTALVTAKLWGKGTDGGKQFEWVLWFSDTYVRTPQGWRYVFGQASLPLPQKSAHHIDVPVVPARPEDVSSPEAIVKADYESISGGIGVPRQWARDFSLYDPDAHSFVVYKDSKTGSLTPWCPTQQEYVDEVDDHLTKAGFSEGEVGHKVYRFGNVATVLSSYEGKLASTGKLYTRGVNIYQLYFADKRWWISSVSWDGENYINEIPAELLPQK